MKTILLILITLPCFAQIKTGVWSLNDYVIERPNDSTQIEHWRGKIDTLRIEWIHSRKYRVIMAGRPTLTATVTRITKRSYSGFISDGKKEKYFEMIKISNYD
jgi:hypothetical protein